ncbi:MAG: adenosine kinase [Ilumatobacter sp.]|nr:adenosine kinase [bacterium]NKB40394.1 adenosine kinase [Ilumatobacter sp.]
MSVFGSQSSRSSSLDQPRYDVVGIGNALVDVIAHAPEHFLKSQQLVKGSMTLIETERAVELYAALSGAVEMSGGSAANTVCGVASFRGRAAYIGKVNTDDLGQVFGHDMRAVGVTFAGGRSEQPIPTGRCVIVVTPDAERTMNTYLGVSSMLSVDDLDEEVIAQGQILYMEGYLYDRDDAKAAFRHAAGVAHEHGRTVSLTLSDSFCVDRHRDDFRGLVADSVDLLFGNEDELLSLYQLESFDDAVAALRSECSMAVVTRGAAGCVVVTHDELVEVPAVQVKAVVDTTGAGDLFAAGFLHGLTTGADVSECGRLGSIAAAEVISHVGPRPLVELHTLRSDD